MASTYIHHTTTTPSASTADFFISLTRITDYFFGILYGLAFFRFILEFFSANESNPFKAALNFITDPFVIPFLGLFDDPLNPRWSLAFCYFVAFLVFIIAEAVIKGFFRLFWAR